MNCGRRIFQRVNSYSVKYRSRENEGYCFFIIKAENINKVLERACIEIASNKAMRPEDVHLHSVYDLNGKLLWGDELYYSLIRSENRSYEIERREFLKAFGLTSVAILFGSPLRLAQAATTSVVLSGLASGFGAQSLDFDGTNDYLIRSSDLTGNVDGKKFTFSCWVYINQYHTNGSNIFYSWVPGQAVCFTVRHNKTGLQVVAYNAATNVVLDVTAPIDLLNTFIHVLISVDLSSTTLRYIYINDLPVAPTWTSYTNSFIRFTGTEHVVGNNLGNTGWIYKGRIGHLFFDYTYRDLSVESNRRLFITADRKPASNQVALTPIVYLSTTDPSQPGKNTGTGGDFVLNGIIARSGRGPNQDNVSYSSFNGTTAYLSKNSALVGTSASSLLTFVFSINTTFPGGSNYVIKGATGAGLNRFVVDFQSASKNMTINGYDSSGTLILSATVSGFVVGRNYHVIVSLDLSSTTKRLVYINGAAVTATWNTYTNGQVDIGSTATLWGVFAAPNNGSAAGGGCVGGVWFDTKYIDISQTINLSKFVSGTGIDAKAVDLGANGELPTGSAPLIYLPMYGSNAGKNSGTGGDFMVNSGPFPGVRGPSEFWGNFVNFEGGYLRRASSLNGASDGKTFSAVVWVKFDTNSTYGTIIGAPIGLRRQTTNGLEIYDVGTGNLYGLADGTLESGSVKCIQICVDLTSTTKRFLYINGVQYNPTWSTYVNSNMNLSIAAAEIGRSNGGGQSIDGQISELYMTTNYIDFSQEENRLKFRDAFGKPVNLTPQIQAGSLPNPLIYMRFDPANMGKNSGTGGDFTINGSMTDGGQL